MRIVRGIFTFWIATILIAIAVAVASPAGDLVGAAILAIGLYVVFGLGVFAIWRARRA